MQLPFEADSKRYALFLKHVREQLRNTNIVSAFGVFVTKVVLQVIYTEDLGTVHSVLAQANRLNMTESRHSFLVANMVWMGCIHPQLNSILLRTCASLKIFLDPSIIATSLASNMFEVTHSLRLETNNAMLYASEFSSTWV